MVQAENSPDGRQNFDIHVEEFDTIVELARMLSLTEKQINIEYTVC